MIKENKFYSELEMKKHDWKNTGKLCGVLQLWQKNRYKAYRHPKTGMIYNIVKLKKTRRKKWRLT